MGRHLAMKDNKAARAAVRYKVVASSRVLSREGVSALLCHVTARYAMPTRFYIEVLDGMFAT